MLLDATISSATTLNFGASCNKFITCSCVQSTAPIVINVLHAQACNHVHQITTEFSQRAFFPQTRMERHLYGLKPRLSKINPRIPSQCKRTQAEVPARNRVGAHLHTSQYESADGYVLSLKSKPEDLVAWDFRKPH